uniref:Carboxylic ester hydrolase n=1 Tax=Panagrolaimus sp. PS1159 TaxID=55785 RepID=A0AC35GMX6_9BILA
MTDLHDRSNSVFVQTQYGQIEGFIHVADDGIVANIFLGVPYAKPPIGELRFERPIPPEPWQNILKTKQFRDSCIPYNYDSIQNEPFSEDCLYINVIAPSEPSDDPKGYPVLVYIHGGGFWYGDVVKCGFDKASKVFASRGLITVTVPYRVGLYGFMSLGTAEDPGNIGLWDQIAALKFIKENIKYFGGNPNNIIVWGQSAGSASVDLLTLSPHSRNLFHKAIEGSGVATCEFAGSQPSTRVTKELAAAMGCTSTNPTEIKAFLKNQTWQDIMNVSSTQFIPDKAYPNYLAPPKPLIVGLMTLEGGTFIWLAGKPASELATYSAENVTETIRKSYAPEIKVGPEYEAIQNDIINYFLYQNVPSNANSSFYIQRHAELQSDLMFNQQIFNETDLKVKNGWPVYFYLWNHMSSPVQATLPAAKGAWHTSEIYYVFDQLVYDGDVLGPDEIKIQNYYGDIFAQFAYTGNPRTPENKFPRYDLITRRILWIDPTLSIKFNFIAERRLFWEKHVSKFNFNILRGRTRNEIIDGSPLDD